MKVIKLWKINKLLRIPYLPNKLRQYLIHNLVYIPSRLDGRSHRLRYVVFDTETTGLDLAKDRILSIGAIGIEGNSMILEDSFYRVVQYDQEVNSKRSIDIHGILPEESKWGYQLDSVIQDFLDYIKNSILVAHHSDFDVEMVNKYLRRNYSIEILNPVIDTAILVKRIDSAMNSNEYGFQNSNLNLDALCERFKIGTEGRHNSLGDAYITAELFLKLTAKLIRMGKRFWKHWTL